MDTAISLEQPRRLRLHRFAAGAAVALLLAVGGAAVLAAEDSPSRPAPKAATVQTVDASQDPFVTRYGQPPVVQDPLVTRYGSG
jgi:hypothetical protein